MFEQNIQLMKKIILYQNQYHLLFLQINKHLQATTVLAGFAYDNIYYVFDIEVCLINKY